MNKVFLLIANLNVYNICDAIENNAQIWWNNSNKKLSKGTEIFIYTKKHILYRGICGQTKVANNMDKLPGKEYWKDNIEVKNMLENGNFIEINDIKSVIPITKGENLVYSTSLEEIKKNIGKEFSNRGMRELSEIEVEYLSNKDIRWV